jgi:riboflavin biosynthesis pyrimidine reductase
LKGEVVEEVSRLKQRLDGEILVPGSIRLVRALIEHDLLDELRLWFHPLLVGKGGPDDLLYRDNRLTAFELVDNTPLGNGIVILSYRVAR